MRVPDSAVFPPTVVKSNCVRDVFCPGCDVEKTFLNVGVPSTAGQLRQIPRLNAAA